MSYPDHVNPRGLTPNTCAASVLESASLGPLLVSCICVFMTPPELSGNGVIKPDAENQRLSDFFLVDSAFFAGFFAGRPLPRSGALRR